MDKRNLGIILATVIFGSIGAYWYWGSMIKKPLTLRYGYTPFADSAPLYVAVEMGFFEEENLNASLTKFLVGTQILEAAVAGSIDMGFVGFHPALLAFQEGVDLRITGGGSYYDEKHDPFALIVRADSSIQSIKDLKGKTITTYALGATGLFGYDVVLRRHGLTLEDVNIVIIRSQLDELEAIKSGTVDVGWLVEPFLTPTLESGEVRILHRVYTEMFPDHKYPMATTFVLKSFIDEHKDVVDAFIRAYGKAVDWINGHPMETREIVARWTGIDPELARKMALHAFSKQLDPEMIERIIDLMLEYGYLEKDIKLEDIMYQG